ncbi:MAG: PKD domain-containing protein, partial [Actinomycetota bacterium]
SYQWTFGDGQSTTTATPTIQHTYAAGSYTASLVVVDNLGAPSQPDTVNIQAGNTAPTPTITSPAEGTVFTVGQTLTLTGSATDAQDGTLPASSLTWTVLRHHQAGTPSAHTHPWFGPTTGNNLTFQAPAPEDLAATTNSFLEVILTATDSGGLSTTVTRTLMPKTVAITFATNPAGRIVNVNGTQLVGPTTITSWQGYVLNVMVPKQNPWKWVSWSDGGARNHSITTPASPTTYTATFQQGGGGCGRNC